MFPHSHQTSALDALHAFHAAAAHASQHQQHQNQQQAQQHQHQQPTNLHMHHALSQQLAPHLLSAQSSLMSPMRRIGHPYQNRTPPKRKKPRTSFTKQQIHELERRFIKQRYLGSADRAALAKGLKMTDAQVKTW